MAKFFHFARHKAAPPQPIASHAGLMLALAILLIAAWAPHVVPLRAEEPQARPPSSTSDTKAPKAKSPAKNESAAQGWRETSLLAAAEAFQAAAADAQFVYAIDSTRVVQYERATGRRAAESRGEARHLNSGFFHEGLLLCAHSNYPAMPERSEIKSYDPRTQELKTWRDFGDFGGSLTWVLRHDGAWWCNFARYGADNAQTFLVRFDDAWRETGRWRYPPELIKKFGAFSASGGVWLDGRLFVTGHDAQELYEITVPREGRTLEFHATHPAPFTGQGIAVDPRGQPGEFALVGIDRARRQLVFARRSAPRRDASPERAP